MPISFSDLIQDRRVLEFSFLDDKVVLTYRPSGITPEVEDRLQGLIETRRSSNSMAEFLAGVLVEWDVENDDGTPYPTTLESLRKLPGNFLVRMVNEITDDMMSGVDDRKNSGAGSPAKRNRSERSRNGTR